jgi:AsmA protein
MKRVLLVLVAVVVFAVAGAAGYTWWFLSQFDARAEIERRVEAATGRDCEIKGAVSVTFWPTLGFKGADASLANAPGGSAAHMLTAREVVIGMALEPLMQRRLEVHEFILVEPVVALEVDVQGRPNWILKPVAPSRPQQPTASGAKPTTFSLHGMRVIDGRFSYANLKTKSAYAIEDVDARVDLDGMEAPLTVSGEATFRGQRAVIDLTVGVFRALTTGQPTPLKASLTAPALSATLDGTLDVKTGGLSGELSASGPSLRGLAAWAGNPLGQGPGLEAFKIAGRLDVGVKRYAFDNAAIEIDNIKSRGDFLIEQGPRAPFLSGRLEVAALDLNPYLAPRTQAGGVQVASVQQVDVKSPGWSDIPIDLTGLKAVNANLELTTGPLQIQKTKLDRTQVSLLLNDGYLIATMRELEMYGGNGTGRFEIDARGADVTIRNELAVQKVDAQRFFADAFGFTNLEGTAKIDWGFSGRGATQKSLMGSLTGDGAFTFQNGALRGVNLGGVGRTIRDAMRGEMVSPAARTPFSSFTATIKAADGVLATNDLQMVAPQARINAIGVIDMGGRTIDMRLTPRLSGVAVPFRVSGAWTGIGYASDILGRARPGIEARVRAVRAKAPRR